MPITSRIVREAKDIPPEERIVIQIIPLKFISAQEVTKVITPFISADGTIIAEGGSNTLLVVDKGINILKVLKLVEAFDVSVFERMSYRFYPLRHINTDEAVKLLKEVLSQATGGSKEDVKFIPITRLNTLLIVSPSPDVFGRLDAFIRQLDIPSESAQPQIYIYSVKNGMATELGETVQAIFAKRRRSKGFRVEGERAFESLCQGRTRTTPTPAAPGTHDGTGHGGAAARQHRRPQRRQQ